MFKKLISLKILTSYIILILLFTGCQNTADNDSELYKCADKNRMSSHAECSLSRNSIIKIELLDEEDNQQFCTGTVLKNKVILTAAHCFNEFVFNAFVTIDSTKIKIASVHYHPKFNHDNQDSDASYDLAYAVLESEIPNYSEVKVYDNASLKNNDQIVFFGYGRLTEEDLSSAGTLRAGSMKIKSVNDQFIIGSLENKNICFGDSGGPVFLYNDIHRGIIGTVSQGSDDSCSASTEAYFTIFTEQASKDFIQQALLTN